MKDFEAAPSPDFDEPRPDETPGRQATIELLGEDIVISLEGHAATLERIDGVARTEDPFKLDGESELDLGFLKPEQAERIVGPQARGWSNEELSSMKWIAMTRLAMKITKKSSGFHLDIQDQIRDGRTELEETDKAITRTFGDYPEDSRGLDFEKVQAFMDSLAATAGRLPSKATMRVLDSLYSASMGIYRFRRERLEKVAEQSRLGRTMGPPKVTTQIIDTVDGLKIRSKVLNSSAHSARNQGSQCHEEIIHMVKTEQGCEALRMLNTISAAKRLVPKLGDLTEAQIGTAIDTELYLAGQAGVVESTLKGVDPAFLSRPEVQSKINGLRTPTVSKALETERSRRQQEAAQEVARDLNAPISEARDILRGGRRLQPLKGQSADQIRRQADALHALEAKEAKKLLEPEESGVIMAVVTGKFGNFVGILERVKTGGDEKLAIIEKSRPEPVQALRGFDLAKASSKIVDILRAPGSRPKLIDILTAGEVAKVETALDGILKAAAAKPE